MDRETDTQRDKGTERQREIQTEGQTGQRDRQTDR